MTWGKDDKVVVSWWMGDELEPNVKTIPLDPNKILQIAVQPPTKEPWLKGGRRPAFWEEKAGQIPKLAGLLTEPTLGGQIARKAPQIAGGTIGGAVGAAIPSIGEEAGLALGGAKAAQYLYAPAMAALGGAGGRALTLSPDDPNYEQKLLLAAIEEGAGEFGGRLAAAGLGRGLRFFRGAVEPGAEAADTALRTAGAKTAKGPPRTWVGKAGRGLRRKGYMALQSLMGEPGGAARVGQRYGAHLMPGQTTESFMDTLQAVAEASLGSGPAVRRYQTQTQTAALKNVQDNFIDTVKKNLIKKLGAKRTTILLAGDLAGADAKTLKEVVDSLYSAIDDIAGVKVDISPLKDLAEEYIGKGLKPGARQAMLRKITKKESLQTFSELKDIRSDILQYARQFDKAGQNNNARIAKIIGNKADELMETTAHSVDNVEAHTRRSLQRFHKGPQYKLFAEKERDLAFRVNKGIITIEEAGKILDDYAEQLKLPLGKEIQPGSVYAAWRAANEFYRGTLKVKWLGDTYRRYSTEGVLSRGFVNFVEKTTDNDFTRLGFSANEINSLRDLANTVKFTRKKATAGGATMLVRLLQAGALVGIPVGALTDKPIITAPSVAVLIGPELLARLMLSPTGSKLLSTGLKAPAGSRSAATLSLRLLREVAYYESINRFKGQAPQLWVQWAEAVTPQPAVVEQIRKGLKEREKALKESMY